MDGFSRQGEQKNHQNTDNKGDGGEGQGGRKRVVGVIGRCWRLQRNVDDVNLSVAQNTACRLGIDGDGGIHDVEGVLWGVGRSSHGEQAGVGSGCSGDRVGWDGLAQLQFQKHLGVFTANDVGKGLGEGGCGRAVQPVAPGADVGGGGVAGLNGEHHGGGVDRLIGAV